MTRPYDSVRCWGCGVVEHTEPGTRDEVNARAVASGWSDTLKGWRCPACLAGVSIRVSSKCAPTPERITDIENAIRSVSGQRCAPVTAPWTPEREREAREWNSRQASAYHAMLKAIDDRERSVEDDARDRLLDARIACATMLPAALDEIERLQCERNALLRLVRMIVDGWEGAENVPTATIDERIGEWVVVGYDNTGGAGHLSDALEAVGYGTVDGIDLAAIVRGIERDGR